VWAQRPAADLVHHQHTPTARLVRPASQRTTQKNTPQTWGVRAHRSNRAPSRPARTHPHPRRLLHLESRPVEAPRPARPKHRPATQHQHRRSRRTTRDLRRPVGPRCDRITHPQPRPAPVPAPARTQVPRTRRHALRRPYRREASPPPRARAPCYHPAHREGIQQAGRTFCQRRHRNITRRSQLREDRGRMGGHLSPGAPTLGRRYGCSTRQDQ
jgi:hypothetical protein